MRSAAPWGEHRTGEYAAKRTLAAWQASPTVHNRAGNSGERRYGPATPLADAARRAPIAGLGPHWNPRKRLDTPHDTAQRQRAMDRQDGGHAARRRRQGIAGSGADHYTAACARQMALPRAKLSSHPGFIAGVFFCQAACWRSSGGTQRLPSSKRPAASTIGPFFIDASGTASAGETASLTACSTSVLRTRLR